ncbi:hypothetical protein C7460_12265 [Marinoscillum furvescens DSM 4134]|uniref:Uncharacterized protein n=1 Tax=Marinoscillum furvescens DSM 4134 TaxID=1122208 RepID=A0A3D9KXY8_MARFU|nr:hypothetical protein C7460_12265 [Marinoscillum furvescens DSM 4134]
MLVVQQAELKSKVKVDASEMSWKKEKSLAD